MDLILSAVGVSASPGTRVGLNGVFVAGVSLCLIAWQVVLWAFGLHPVLLQALGWGAWFVWQGWLFNVHRERYLAENPDTAYRKAFLRDIVPGVSFGVSQMVRPFLYGLLMTRALTLTGPWFLFGLLIMACGLGLLFLGFRTLGLAGAGFLFEYKKAEPRLNDHSIYAYVRHPLFLGGVIASFGSSLLIGDPGVVMMAVINLAALPVYARLEDVRLIQVFGSSYARYRAAVGAFVPRLGLLRLIRKAG